MSGRIFAINPGSKRTGWAVFDSRERLLRAGVLTGDKTTDVAEFRIRAMCKHFRELLIEWSPHVVLIDWTSGHIGRRRHHGGAVVGALWQTAETWASGAGSGEKAIVRCINPDLWAGGTHQETRQVAIAIGLACWWAREQNLVPF